MQSYGSRARKVPWWLVPLTVFALSRLIDLLLVLVVGDVPSKEYFNYAGLPIAHVPLHYGNVIAAWDGEWYRHIATHGYPLTLPRVGGHVVSNAWAFAPLYPAVVALGMLIGLSFWVSASIVSLFAGGVAVCVVYRLMRTRASAFTGAMTVAALSFAPAAPIFQFAYTESLALLFVVLALAALGSRRYAAFCVLALLLALTRPVELPLAAVCGVLWLMRWRRRAEDPFPRREQLALAASAAAAGLFYFAWPIIAGIVTGEPNAFLLTHEAWGRSSGSTLLMDALHGRVTPPLLEVVLVVGLILYLVRRPDSRRWPAAFRAWAVVYPLFLVTTNLLAGSVIRYFLLVSVVYWPLPELGEVLRSRRAKVAIFLAVAVIGSVINYFWLRKVYMPLPGTLGPP